MSNNPNPIFHIELQGKRMHNNFSNYKDNTTDTLADTVDSFINVFVKKVVNLAYDFSSDDEYAAAYLTFQPKEPKYIKWGLIYDLDRFRQLVREGKGIGSNDLLSLDCVCTLSYNFSMYLLELHDQYKREIREKAEELEIQRLICGYNNNDNEE